jgi:hypothetical protein
MRQHRYPQYEVLEEHTCIYEVSRREIELQEEYGYGVDTPVEKHIDQILETLE